MTKRVSYSILLPILPMYFLSKYRALTVALLILTVSFSPRISFGTLDYNRSLELRYEDFLLVLILFSWLLYFCLKKKISSSNLTKPILVYIFLATISTFFGVLADWIEPIRAIFYYLKEIQYFLMFFVVINFIKSYADLTTAVWALLIGGLANDIYALFQFVSGDFVGAARGYYGISSIGEPSSFSTGGYFSIISLLALMYFYFACEKSIKIVSIIVFLFSGLALLASGSRANIYGTGIAVLLFLIITQRRRFSRRMSITLVILVFLLIIFNVFWGAFDLPTAARIVDLNGIKHSLQVRVELAYMPFWEALKTNIIFGLGKSISGTNGFPTEAHNHYIRILVEMGVLGLISFLYLLLKIIKMSLKVYKTSLFSLGKATGYACLFTTVSLMIAASVQDAFTPVKVNELYWILVGLTASVYRLSLKEILKGGKFNE